MPLKSNTGPRVVHCKRDGFDVLIDRRTKWGNPFYLPPGGDREACIAKYRKHLLSRPDLMAALPELRGKVLGCWCSPKACHGDVLMELANPIGGAPVPDECEAGQAYFNGEDL